MCVMSMVVDHYRERWSPHVPVVPMPYPFPITQPFTVAPSPISQDEVDEFRKLLDRARKYDKEHNQPDCELEEKRKALLEIAEKLGLKIDFL